jgi:hypothetical protein
MYFQFCFKMSPPNDSKQFSTMNSGEGRWETHQRNARGRYRETGDKDG